MNKWLALALLWIGYVAMNIWLGCMKLAFKLNPPPKMTVEQELYAAGLFLNSAHRQHIGVIH